MPRLIHEIATDIIHEWKNVNYAAKPYLEAMLNLSYITDRYGYDSATGIIKYFLGNARTFKGEKARELKLELSQLIGITK